MMAVASLDDEVTKCIPSPVGGLPVGTRIQDYCIKGVVGEGGFAIVYLADDVLLHREVAIKEYMPAALAVRNPGQGVGPRSASHGETFIKGMRSFINEARLLAQFKHVALIDVLRFWEQNGTAYMAMPYYRGKTLREIFRQADFHCDEAWLRRLIEPILSGVQTMHRENCFHRDISTDNIIVLANGNPVLLDFGAARRIVAAPDQLATVILKPGFAPIEQYSDDTATAPQGPWTDIYALCAVCYLAISGRMPATSVARIMRDPVVSLTSLDIPGFTANFLVAIDRGLAVRPEDRPQSVKEFAALLDRPSPVKARPIVPPSPAQDKGNGSPVGQTSTPAPAKRVSDAGRSKDPATAAAAITTPVIVNAPESADRTPRRRSSDRVTAKTPDRMTSAKARSGRGRRNYSLLIGVALAFGLALLMGYLRMSRAPSPPARDNSALGQPLPGAKSPVAEVVAVPTARPPEPVLVPDGTLAAPVEPVPLPPLAPRSRPVATALEPATAEPRTAFEPQDRKPSGTRHPAADLAATPASSGKAAAGDSPVFSKGAVNIRVRPWGLVAVDGRPLGASPPLQRIWLPVGKHTVLLTHPRGTNFATEIMVAESGVVEVVHDFAAAPSKPR
jgi:non-specific serine/threonine protein kinase